MAQSSIEPDLRGASSASDDPRALVRLSPFVVVAIAVGLVILGQVVEDLADSEPLQLLAPASAIRRWTLIVAVLYMLVISRVVDSYVGRSLDQLSGVVEGDPDRLRGHAAQMRRPPPPVDAALLAVSAVVVGLVFVGLQTSLPIDDPVTNVPRFLPGNALAALLVLVQYTLVGWAVLTVVYCTIRRARALGALARERLSVDVFDTTNLLPLGNIALATALAPAGIVVILLFGFGAPTAPLSWTLLVLVTLASILALILPLRGIHRQMDTAKDRALSDLSARLRELYEQVNDEPAADAVETQRLNNRATMLINLRKTVGEMTTWPFRDTLAFSRAVLIAAAPLVYTFVNELIKVFLISPLSP